MRCSTFWTRALAALIDFTIVATLCMTVCAWVVGNVFGDMINQQMAPFLMIEMLLSPLTLLMQTISTPRAYGNVGVIYVLYAICFSMEFLYYSLFEVLPFKRTPGYMIMKIRVCCDRRGWAARVVERNLLKVISRYLYAVPFVLSAFDRQGRTVYDRMCRVYVKKDGR